MYEQPTNLYNLCIYIYTQPQIYQYITINILILILQNADRQQTMMRANQFSKLSASGTDDNEINENSASFSENLNKQQKYQRLKTIVLISVGVVFTTAFVLILGLYIYGPLQLQRHNLNDVKLQNTSDQNGSTIKKQVKQKQHYELILQRQQKEREQYLKNPKEQYQLPLDTITEEEINKDAAEKFVTPQIKKLFKQNRQFDIHYYVDDPHLKMKPKILNRAKKFILFQDRPILDLNKTVDELEGIIQIMKHPKARPEKMPQWKHLKDQLPSLTDQTFFADQLNKNPDNPQYAKGQFYYYDRKYQIGKYGKQLPMCVVCAGKNNANVVIKMYESIRRQNYTNFRIVQIDDNSNDDTIKVVTKYLNENPYMKKRTTFVHQMYQRTALYNRHYGNMEHCPQDSIIVDVDTDDWLVGKQVFQLVNSIYQAGNYVKGQKFEVWSLFLDFIYRADDGRYPISKLYGQINPKFFNTYRIEHAWRTTELRTYYRRVYAKVDPKDFVDMHSMRKGQFFGETYDLFMIVPIFEQCQPNHVKILDEFVYFYSGSADRDTTYPQYSGTSARILPVYTPLKKIQDDPVRGPVIAPKNLIDWNAVTAKSVDQRFKKYRDQVLQLYQKQKKNSAEKQNKQNKI